MSAWDGRPPVDVTQWWWIETRLVGVQPALWEAGKWYIIGCLPISPEDTNGWRLIAPCSPPGSDPATWARAIEAAAGIAKELEDKWTAEWRAGHKCDANLEGMSNGAADIATAISQLKLPEAP